MFFSPEGSFFCPPVPSPRPAGSSGLQPLLRRSRVGSRGAACSGGGPAGAAGSGPNRDAALGLPGPSRRLGSAPRLRLLLHQRVALQLLHGGRCVNGPEGWCGASRLGGSVSFSKGRVLTFPLPFTSSCLRCFCCSLNSLLFSALMRKHQVNIFDVSESDEASQT